MVSLALRSTLENTVGGWLWFGAKQTQSLTLKATPLNSCVKPLDPNESESICKQSGWYNMQRAKMLMQLQPDAHTRIWSCGAADTEIAGYAAEVDATDVAVEVNVPKYVTITDVIGEVVITPTIYKAGGACIV